MAAGLVINQDDNGAAAVLGCNGNSGTYGLSGEGLSVKNPALTQKACAPPQMNQEQRFVAALRAVDRFDFTPDGARVIRSGAQRSIKGRF